ncbi:MAG: hypothetical protein EU541_05845 [Promethearchaeota archaeon]|nr:MAG: hypothetical protein EU541_05845 [Candidatus Lokiarchaeota archaeon]
MKQTNFPILVGASQYTQTKKVKNRLDPLSLMEKTGNMVIKNSTNKPIREYIDAIFMININSWSYKDAPSELAKRLNLNLKKKVYLPDGGNTPQMLINRAANAIYKNKFKAVLVIGAEAAYSLLLSKKGNKELDWPKRRTPDYMEGEIWDGINDFENKYKFKFPPYTYAVFETAVRASLEHTLEEHEKHMGKLFQHFSEVAANHPYSWSQNAYNANQIISPTTKNRKICHPYMKLMCSNMFVDQSAAVLLTQESLAEKLAIPKENWVYLMGTADFKNIHEITQRPALHTSPACREGSRIALEQAGLKLSDIDAFDLYSCFPSIVEIMMEEIGISESDSRNLTLTGGLPYFGGPWSNYSLHAIATAVDLIHKNPHFTIMVVANGGYNSKQSFGIYGKRPPKIPFNELDLKPIQKRILNNKLDPPLKIANGILTVEGYTIIFNRNQEPKEGIVIGKLDTGRRTLAFIKENQEKLEILAKQELVNKKLRVRYNEKLECNIILFD